MTHQSTLTHAELVPPSVAQLAANSGLGEFQRIYVPKKHHPVAVILWLLIGLATTIILVGFALLWLLFRTPDLSRSQARRRIYRYDGGFITMDRPDDLQVYRWDGIDTVFQRIVIQRTYGIKVNTTYLYTITRRDGRTLKLTKFWAEIPEFGPYINERVSAALLPGVLAAIGRGQAIQFGDMTLNAGGISGRRKSVAWTQVSGVRIHAGYVSVDIEGKFFALSTTEAAKLPNLPLFFALTERLRLFVEGAAFLPPAFPNIRVAEGKPQLSAAFSVQFVLPPQSEEAHGSK